MIEVEIEFRYTLASRWMRTTLNAHGYASIMNSGMIDGKSICDVRVWHSTDEEEDNYLVYSFAAAGSGSPAWSVIVIDSSDAS